MRERRGRETGEGGKGGGRDRGGTGLGRGKGISERDTGMYLLM